jgi:hypothetical protein
MGPRLWAENARRPFFCPVVKISSSLLNAAAAAVLLAKLLLRPKFAGCPRLFFLL